jgi:hypothetical protein
MLPFGVTIPSTVKQRSEIPEGIMNYPALKLSNNGNLILEILYLYTFNKFNGRQQKWRVGLWAEFVRLGIETVNWLTSARYCNFRSHKRQDIYRLTERVLGVHK